MLPRDTPLPECSNIVPRSSMNRLNIRGDKRNVRVYNCFNVVFRAQGKMKNKKIIIIKSTQYLSPLLIISTHQLSAYYIPYLTSIRKSTLLLKTPKDKDYGEIRMRYVNNLTLTIDFTW